MLTQEVVEIRRKEAEAKAKPAIEQEEIKETVTEEKAEPKKKAPSKK